MRGRLRQARGAVLVMVLVFLAAGAALSTAVARTAALELAMTEQGLSRLQAQLAAEAGLDAALAAQGWSASAPWQARGELPQGGRWTAMVTLVAARLDPGGGAAEWIFEARSTGEAGPARTTVAQGFRVQGALPGVPQAAWWHRVEAEP
jgi:hypothetical protein